MKVVIPIIGTRGDVQPFIALAQGLARSGHTATLASHPVMKTLVESHGVPFAPVGPDIDLGQEVADIRTRSRNAMAGLVRGMRFAFKKLEESHEDILALCRGADLVVVHAQSAAGKNEADQLNLPYFSVTFVPWGIPWDDPDRPFYKRIAYRAIDGSVSLLTFIESGEPPLVVSLGAMSLGSSDTGGAMETAGLFVDAIRQAGVRAIVQGWEAAMKRLSLPEMVYAAGPLPHNWLLPRSAGLVHHGGFGTTSAGLRAGIPALVIPHLVDQFYWGQRVYELGAGLQSIPRTKLNTQGLAAALAELAHNGELRAAASHLGELIRSENGIHNAVRLIEETFC